MDNDFELNIFKNFTLLFFISFCCLVIAQEDNIYRDIYKVRELAKNKSLELEKRYEYARKAIAFSKKTKEDSTLLISNRILSSMFIDADESDSILKINKENLHLASKLKDTLRMAFAANNIAYGYDLLNNSVSAYKYYSTAEKYYNKVNRKIRQVDVLYNMARAQETERDFIGSEISAIRAIEILDGLENNDEVDEWQWNVNNLLAIVASRIELYDEAIQYHNKALSFTKSKSADPYNALFSRINIAILNRRNKEYNKSIELFEQLLKDGKLKTVDPLSYVTVISNIAYVKLLKGDKDYANIESKLKVAFEIANSEEDNFELLSVGKYLSEFYLKTKEKDSALLYANKSLKLAKEENANQAILDVLLLKSKIDEGEASKSNLYEYVKLSDSLVLAERSISNKFARIDYQTDVIKKEKEQASILNTWLIIISLSLLSMLLLVYVIKTQREKNKELQLAKQQQEANEEIYNLMLSQQDKMDEARSIEKKRISQEIHDGILGRLFGARLSLDSLNLLKTDEAIMSRENYIKELKDVEQDIRKVSHDLNTDFIANASFLSLITTLVERQCDAYSLEYDLTSQEGINWDILNNKTKIHLYRIIQESLQNIYKHAKANLILINIKQENNLISLKIEDNGVGFDTNRSKDGIGLKNMRSRVNEINGEFTIEKNQPKGTRTIIDVPI